MAWLMASAVLDGDPAADEMDEAGEGVLLAEAVA